MIPFAAESHTLGPCLLRPPAEADLRPLAEALAAMDPWRTLGFSADALHRYLGREDAALHRFIIERDGAVGGLLAVRLPWLRGPYIELLAVLPSAQGGGVGRSIMDWTRAQAALAGANLWACVSAFNEPARRFYAASGFVEVGQLDDLVAPGEAEILLRLRVKP
jgi:GNAT superfamily N-acetyltransferase